LSISRAPASSVRRLERNFRSDRPGLPEYDGQTHAEEALKASEARLSQLLEATNILVWEAEPENWRFTYVSEQAVKMLGYPITEWYEPDFLASHIYRDDQQRALSIYRKHSQLANYYDLEFRMISADGRIVWLQNLVSVTRENGKPTKMRGFMIDISERNCAEEALQELGGRLITAQEEERSRIARELHDGLNQRIALLSIELSQLALDTQTPLNLNRTVRKLQAQVQEISTDVHRLSYKLHPSKLDHLGLAPAVKSLCKELSETLNIELKQTGFPATLPQDVTLCAFRIVQEALRNCVRHSSARTVKVSLEKSDDAVRISVSDDGCGFDMESNAMKKGLGFISMRERLHLVGGAIQIQSQRLHGTEITVLIPLSPDKDLTYETKGPRALLDPTMRSKTIRSENWRKL
jgi:PAS domain S-box-containing protein